MSLPLTGAEGFVGDAALWRQATGSRAPSYHRVLEELEGLLQDDSAEGTEVAARLADAWASRTFRIFYDRPLLLLAALRRDALVEGTQHPLWSALAAAEPDARSVTRGALLDALARESVWQSVRTRFVQTNETSRAVAWRWPAQLLGRAEAPRPIALVEVGCAAGLNLVADRLPAEWTTAAGVPLLTGSAPHVVSRLGIDARPLDACRDDDADWLRACVWAGERGRIARLEAALAAFRADPAPLEPGDVTEIPARLRALSAQWRQGAVVLAFQTIVRDYLDAHTRSVYEAGMRRWLQDAPAATALWVELELDLADAGRVPLVAHAPHATGVVDLVLGHTGYHPVTVTVDEGAVATLAGLFRVGGSAGHYPPAASIDTHSPSTQSGGGGSSHE